MHDTRYRVWRWIGSHEKGATELEHDISYTRSVLRTGSGTGGFSTGLPNICVRALLNGNSISFSVWFLIGVQEDIIADVCRETTEFESV